MPRVLTSGRRTRVYYGKTGRYVAPATAFLRASATLELLRRAQPVEKVGAELTVTTHQAREAPRSLKYGVFGTRSGVEASIEGVFQQAATSLQHHLVRR